MSAVLELAAFAGVMAVGQFSPGPDMILLTRTALAEGARSGAIMAFGIATGLVVHTSIAVAGMAVALERSPGFRRFVTWVAAAYLGWLASRLIRAAFAPPQPETREKEGQLPKQRPYLRGLICNLLNPKALIFLAATCAPFLGGGHPSWFPFVLVAIVVVQGGLLWALWAYLLQWPPLRTRYERSARWIDGTFGVALVALVVKLLLGS